MKKFLLVSIMVLGVAAFAFAQSNKEQKNNAAPKADKGCECSMPTSKDCNKPKGMGMMAGKMQVTVESKNDAKTIVKSLLDRSYKGYKIKDVKEAKACGHKKAFAVLVKDSSNNEFVFHVNPFGNVRGPALVKHLDAKSTKK